MVWFQRVYRKTPLTPSAPPATPRKKTAGPRCSQYAEDDDGDSPAEAAKSDGEAVAPHPRRPAARQRWRASAPTAGAAYSIAQHLRAAHRVGDRGKEGDGHPEDHRDEVHHVAADQLLPAPRVAEALQDRWRGSGVSAPSGGGGAGSCARRKKEST